MGGKNQTIDYHNAQNLSRLYLEAFQPVENVCKDVFYRSKTNHLKAVPEAPLATVLILTDRGLTPQK